MTTYLSEALRQLVKNRASLTCEYCLIHQNFSMYNHEIDHFVAIKHGGHNTQSNLVFSCLPCNRHKGSDLTSLDPITRQITPLFNPRKQVWTEHFLQEHGLIVGITDIGRTTVFLLKMNEPSRLQLRRVLSAQNLYPNVA